MLLAARASLATAAASDVFVLDFDGVVIDSEPEVTASALMAAALRWPALFNDATVTPGTRQQLLAGMRAVRPVLVRGFEAMVMLRMLLADPGSTQLRDKILGGWHEILGQQLLEWGEDEKDLTRFFEATRNKWMAEHTQAWMRQQQPYAGVREALAECPYPTYIASSKAAHRVSALSGEVLGLDLPADSPRLYASLLPPEEKKAEALRSICARPLCASPSTAVHFVDDRLDTLLAVRDQPDLARVKLYLAGWGYCTAQERAAAAAAKGIQVLALPQFCELLKFGLVMQVDDGCEPTADEVAAGV